MYYLSDNKKRENKVAPRTQEGRFCGYDGETGATLVLDDQGRLQRVKAVTFQAVSFDQKPVAKRAGELRTEAIVEEMTRPARVNYVSVNYVGDRQAEAELERKQKTHNETSTKALPLNEEELTNKLTALLPSPNSLQQNVQHVQ